MHFNRSLGRGLKMLAILNTPGKHRVASLARAVKLPRSTAFRLLCTLVEDGYVWRDMATDTYHPTAMVHALSDGFDGTARLVHAAQGRVRELGKNLIWPVSLATLSGISVVLRQTTDAASPLAVVRYSAGYRAPILDGASGLVLLAFSNRPQSQMILDLLYREDVADPPGMSRPEAERRLTEVSELGYACVHQQGNSSERSSLAVPVRAGGDTLAALAVRFARNAVSQQVIRERFLPALRQAAHGIVGALHGSAVPAASSRSPSVTGFADTEA